LKLAQQELAHLGQKISLKIVNFFYLIREIMHVIEIIQKKRDKNALNKEEINYLINKYVDNSISDYQMAAFLMAICINGMNDEETSWLTDAMLFSGEVISHADGSALIDKHSTGGVGDKISIPLAPAVAACGIRVPMIAGRGLGHTGGTLDKLESIPGFRCDLTNKEYKDQVSRIGCVIMGQTKNIVPADKMLYALRDVSGTIESIPLIASSIMSKKLAEGIDGLVLDVKFGSGAFIKDLDKARILASTMVAIGSHMGKKITACLTNMDQPLGHAIGNTLEMIESIEILKDCGPQDSSFLTVELGAEMLLLGNQAPSLEEGRNLIKQAISSGRAFEKFVQMVKEQGGDIGYIYDPKKFPIAPQKIIIESQKTGFISNIDNRQLGLAAGIIGGGRCQMSDKIDHRVGIKIQVKIGDHVETGQPICTLFVDQKGIKEAINKIENAIEISPHQPILPDLLKDRITTNKF
jgi:pyrimidine-nucleoside phosphorylase